jgi:hypothetical protein
MQLAAAEGFEVELTYPRTNQPVAQHDPGEYVNKSTKSRICAYWSRITGCFGRLTHFEQCQNCPRRAHLNDNNANFGYFADFNLLSGSEPDLENVDMEISDVEGNNSILVSDTHP